MNNASGSELFGEYADYYDALYMDKDYESESKFIADVLKVHDVSPPDGRLLDLGCGTGGHALPLAKLGFEVTGVDRAPAMIKQARRKAVRANLSEATTFLVDDVRTVDLGSTFDAVISMFAVVSYQLADADLVSMFSAVRRHLLSGGVFLFDCWHGPAVVTQQPSVVEKTVRVPGGGTVTRIANPMHNESKHTVDVAYEVVRTDPSGSVIERTREAHTVRYFFPDEIEAMLQQSGLQLVSSGPFGNLSRKPDEQDWNMSVVALAR